MMVYLSSLEENTIARNRITPLPHPHTILRPPGHTRETAIAFMQRASTAPLAPPVPALTRSPPRHTPPRSTTAPPRRSPPPPPPHPPPLFFLLRLLLLLASLLDVHRQRRSLRRHVLHKAQAPRLELRSLLQQDLSLRFLLRVSRSAASINALPALAQPRVSKLHPPQDAAIFILRREDIGVQLLSCPLDLLRPPRRSSTRASGRSPYLLRTSSPPVAQMLCGRGCVCVWGHRFCSCGPHDRLASQAGATSARLTRQGDLLGPWRPPSQRFEFLGPWWPPSQRLEFFYGLPELYILQPMRM
jgi:hypothetical protein